SFTGIGVGDLIVAKLDSNGVQQWFKDGGTNISTSAILFALDSSANVYLVANLGSLTITKDFNGNPFTTYGGHDMLAAQLDTNGNQQWFKVAGGAGADLPRAALLDGTGNLYILNQFNGSNSPKDFNGNPVAGIGNSDVDVIKLDSNGNQQWFLVAGSTGN